MLEYGQKVSVEKQGENGAWAEIHRGIVIGLTTHFAKVYRPKKRDEDEAGDVNPETSEWYAINSKKIKVE